MPAASSRSMSTMAFAIARAVPAFAAAGTSTRNTPGRLPAAPYHPNTGSSGIPTANGSHESVVPFARRSYQPPIASTIAARASSASPPGAASSSPRRRGADHDRPRRVRRHEARRDRLAGLADVVDRGVHEVVEAADRELEERHRHPEAHGRGGVPARDERDQRRRRPRRGPTGTGGPGAARPRASIRAGGAAPAARPRAARRTRSAGPRPSARGGAARRAPGRCRGGRRRLDRQT